MAYPWYRQGTISLTEGSALVTGVETGWSNPAYVRPGDALYVKIAGQLVPVEEIHSIEGNTDLTLASAWDGDAIEDAAYVIAPTAIIRSQTSSLAWDIATFTRNITAFISGEGPPSDEDGQDGWGYIDELGPTYYTKTDGEWSEGIDLVGPPGPAGPAYTGTSVTSLAIGTGSKSLTTQLNLAYLPGARIRSSSAANPTTHYMEGVVASYDAGTGALSFTADRIAGSGTRSDWNINITGDTGAKGDPGASFAAVSTSELSIGTGTRAFTVAAGLAYVAGQRVRASSAANLANNMEGVVASYAGTTLTLTVDRTSGSGTLADWSIGLMGAVGPTGRGYAATSTTSRNIGTGSMSFATQENLAFSPGARVRFASAANPTTHYMEGVLDAYSGSSMTVIFDRFLGSGARADWNINLVGDVGLTGAKGDPGDTGATGKGYGGTSTTSLSISVEQKTFTTQAGLAYVVGSRVRATSAADSNNWMEGRCSSYSSTSLVVEIDLIGSTATGTHSDWVFSIVGERGVPGAGSVDSVNGDPGPNVILEAADIGYAGVPTNYTPAAGNVAGHLEGIDTKLGAAGGGSPSAPQGRLTLQTATPVMATSQTAKTTIYYSPYLGRFVPLYDGSAFVMTDILAELSQATTDTTKSPAAAAANSNYDLFVWNDAGTIRLSRGPAWSSATSRGTGTGTTELERLQGLLVNMRAITNGPAAQRGTYVGTIRTNASSQVDWSLGSSAAGGGAASLGVWNMYNRINVSALVQDSNTSWSYGTATWRAADNSNDYRVSFVRGMNEDAVLAIYAALGLSTSAGAQCGWGVGLDSTSSPSGWTMTTFTLSSANNQLGGNGGYAGLPGLGWHYLQAIENGATNVTFNGNNGKTIAGLSAQMRA